MRTTVLCRRVLTSSSGCTTPAMQVARKEPSANLGEKLVPQLLIQQWTQLSSHYNLVMTHTNTPSQDQLQNIVRGQESKIHSLKQQLAELRSQHLAQVNQITLSHEKIIAQKDYTINILHNELANLKIEAEKNNRDKQKGLTGQELGGYREKVARLEEAVLKVAHDYESKLMEKERQAEGWALRCEAAEKQRRRALEDLSRLDRFEVISRQHKPQRQQTLLWVNKLIDFMARVASVVQKEETSRDQAVSSIVQAIESELQGVSRVAQKQQKALGKARQEMVEEVRALVSQAEADYQQALKGNQEFWDNLWKTQHREDKESVKHLLTKIEQLTKKYKNQTLDLHEQMILSQKECRKWAGSVDELRTSFEERQQILLEQVQFLRAELERVLEGQQTREAALQLQIDRLGQQMHYCASPGDLKAQLASVRAGVEQGQLKSLQQTIVRYLVEVNSQSEQRNQLRQTVKSLHHYLTQHAKLEQPSAVLSHLAKNTLILTNFTEKEDMFISEMSQCIGRLNSTLINPFQKLDKLAQSPEHPSEQYGKEIVQHFQKYRQILKIKQTTAENIKQSSLQLAKHIKQYFPKPVSQLHRHQKRTQTQQIHSNQPVLHNIHVDTTHMLERRVKEVQSQRIKNREQMLNRFKIIEEKLKTVESKSQKNKGPSLHKWQDSIVKKVHELWHTFTAKEQMQSLNNISEEALRDATSKLQECLIDNEGLMQEIQMLKRATV